MNTNKKNVIREADDGRFFEIYGSFKKSDKELFPVDHDFGIDARLKPKEITEKVLAYNHLYTSRGFEGRMRNVEIAKEEAVRRGKIPRFALRYRDPFSDWRARSHRE